MNNTCPKCNKEISPFYLKESCPHCGVNVVYYGFDERLAADEIKAKKEVDAVNRFISILKSSSISHPILIVRLVLFFTPLITMCLPMYKDISLIKLIMGIINGSFEIGSVIMPLVSMAMVVVLSLAVIISSLFSSTKFGFARNVIFSVINTIVFVSIGLIIGSMGIGWYLTLVIYALELVIHYFCNKRIKNID